MNVVKFATKYCAFLKRNLTFKGKKCGPLKISSHAINVVCCALPVPHSYRMRYTFFCGKIGQLI